MNYLVWGTGRIAEEGYSLFSKISLLKDNKIVAFVDNNPEKWGKLFKDKIIISPSEIQQFNYDAITIWVKECREEIVEQLRKLGIKDSVVCDIFGTYKQLLKQKYMNIEDKQLCNCLEIMEQKHWLDVYNYYPEVSQGKLQEAFLDEQCGLFYTCFEGKKMYLKRSWNNFVYKNGKKYIYGMWDEQDKNSPHRYENEDIIVENGDVIVDAGVCEGNFSLHHIDKISKAYLIECDDEWMEALQHTFEPYKDKVVFVPKFLSNKNSENSISLDCLVNENVNFIKMDIEGEEINALLGADKILSSNSNIKCAICSYHRHADEQKIKEILERYNFDIYTSDGYMLFIYDSYVLNNPELRKGIVRGIKRKDK